MLNPLDILINLIWWPYEAWKHTTESSRIGVSPDEKKTLRFWYVFAMSLTVAATSIILLLKVPWHRFFD